ncbi:major facilitator superfamily domain-containing protein [Pseudoneurospora amorphoporcata]|uniref:Major facilitator superfamily domain-containing protein n=1 Tax=Pseudoneurospora amorphoporcata TaxID=241081 RepID=A0AAN6SFH3_9PEZI|nr:major facilitator superfamily domain-containing protein [Pseudoneurospora amorphoporcata]
MTTTTGDIMAKMLDPKTQYTASQQHPPPAPPPPAQDPPASNYPLSSTDDVSSLSKPPVNEPSRHRHSSSSHSHSGTSLSSGGLEALHQDEIASIENATRLSTVQTRTSTFSSASRPPDYEVVFTSCDPENPKNWPLWYRCWIIFACSYSTWVVVLYSSSYTATVPGLMKEYHVTNQPVATLGLTTYLFGLACGCLALAPLSELYGRRPIYLVSLVMFALLILPCAMPSSLAEIIVVRFFGALFGAVMVSNSPATVVDIANPDYLALCMAVTSIAPLNGPVTGPLIGGFASQYLGFRWANWIVLILSGAAVIFMATIRETYAPAILRAKAARLRKETGDDRYWSRFDQKVSTIQLLKTNLSRPFILAATEPILWFFNTWISLVYAILYLCFVAYPIVFKEHRGWSTGQVGLAFLGMGCGTVASIVLEPFWRSIINKRTSKYDPETGRPAPEAQAYVMTIGAILTAFGQLAFSWTCLPVSIHWVVPIIFGVPFGMGNTISFIYGSNYLAGAYGLYAASALAANSFLRSVAGGVLPLAGPSMYRNLTPQIAGTILGVLEVLLIPIPIIFYRYGDRIRGRSKVIRVMREEQARDDKRRLGQSERVRKRCAEEKNEEGAHDGHGVMKTETETGEGVVVAGSRMTKKGDEAV